MPARNVTLTVAFQQDYHIVLIVGQWYYGSTRYFGYSVRTKVPYGGIDRIPYWNTTEAYLEDLTSLFSSDFSFKKDQCLSRANHGLSALVVNGKRLSGKANVFTSTELPALFDSSLVGKEVRIKFDPPPTGYR